MINQAKKISTQLLKKIFAGKTEDCILQDLPTEYRYACHKGTERGKKNLSSNTTKSNSNKNPKHYFVNTKMQNI